MSETKFPWKLAKDYATKIFVRYDQMSCCAVTPLATYKCHSDVNGYSDGCTEKNGFGKVAALLIVTD